MAVSYGSGAGSDAFSMTVNDRIKDVQENAHKVTDMISKKSYVDYAVYAKYKGKLRMAWMP
jgi:hydroxymethylglutaryl-CoA synthase